MESSSLEKIQHLDWTRREVSRPETRRFTNEVVWPSIDLLHTIDIQGEYFTQEDIIEFVSIENLVDDEEVFRNPPALESPDNLQLATIELLAYCCDEGSNPDVVHPVGIVDIDLSTRLLDDEKRLLPKNSELEIWQNKVYFVNGGRLYQPISLDVTYVFRDYMGKVVQELSKPLKQILRKFEESVEDDDYTTRREHCLDIANSLVMVGVPEEFIDERMYQFDQTGNA